MSAPAILWPDATAVRRGAHNDEQSGPYPWVAIPPGGVSFYARGSVAAPAYGAGNQAVVCSYTIQKGWEGVLSDVMNKYTDAGGTFNEGSGDIVWDYDVDRPLAGALSTGQYLADYFHIVTSLGDLQQPWPVRGGWRLKPGQIIRQKVYTVANVAVGAPAFCHGALLGWVWPSARTGA